jgi:arylformamidase
MVTHRLLNYTLAISTTFSVLPFSSLALATEPITRCGMRYAEPTNERQTLDVYAPAEGTHHPMVFWIRDEVHDGNREVGVKTGADFKPKAAVDRGYVFVSINHLLFSEHASLKQLAADVAKAIHWTCDHANEFGGDPNTIFVAGYSAGAQLAALVCTDDAYLNAEGMKLSIVKGCEVVDGNTYDIPLYLASEPITRAEINAKKFGASKEQKDLSPVTYIAKNKDIPPFLILYVADDRLLETQAKRLSETLRQAGISSKRVKIEETTHEAINSDIGFPLRMSTCAIFAFLDKITRPDARSLQAFRTKLDKSFRAYPRTPAVRSAVMAN